MSQSSDHIKLDPWTWQWITRSQPIRATLGCGGSEASWPGCASHKSPSTTRCYPININLELIVIFKKPIWNDSSFVTKFLWSFNPHLFLEIEAVLSLILTLPVPNHSLFGSLLWVRTCLHGSKIEGFYFHQPTLIVLLHHIHFLFLFFTPLLPSIPL